MSSDPATEHSLTSHEQHSLFMLAVSFSVNVNVIHIFVIFLYKDTDSTDLLFFCGNLS